MGCAERKDSGYSKHVSESLYVSQHKDPTQLRRKCPQLRFWERVVHRLESSPSEPVYMMGSTLASQHYSTAVFCGHFLSRFSSLLSSIFQRNWRVSYCETRRCPRIGATSLTGCPSIPGCHLHRCCTITADRWRLTTNRCLHKMSEQNQSFSFFI